MKNKGAEYMRNREVMMARGQEARSKQVVASTYCEVVSRIEVTVLAGPEDRRYKSVPTGYESGL